MSDCLIMCLLPLYLQRVQRYFIFLKYKRNALKL
nr:MAG TPA: hypothetical protein [Caudoviricetes sp.]